jgi:hypothetical protein
MQLALPWQYANNVALLQQPDALVGALQMSQYNQNSEEFCCAAGHSKKDLE